MTDVDMNQDYTELQALRLLLETLSKAEHLMDYIEEHDASYERLGKIRRHYQEQLRHMERDALQALKRASEQEPPDAHH